VALDEMMIELAADYRPALAGEEDER